MKKIYILLAILIGSFIACTPEFDHPVNSGNYHAGEADFTTYVAVGNSLTAGYMDGTVFRSGQMYSFPNILAKQFAIVGGGEFTQPSYLDDVNDIGGLILGGTQIGNTRLFINASVGGPQNFEGIPTIKVSTLQKKAYHNMGIPGSRTFHLLRLGYGDLTGVSMETANPYFVRQATSSSATVMDDASSLKPTFFTNWIGNNDVLGYATSGGINDTPGTENNQITPSGIFEVSYNAIVETLMVTAKGGVVATIPDVTAIPFFTTVPFNPLKVSALGGEATIEALNTSLYGPLSAILSERFKPLSGTENNPLLITDEMLADKSAHISMALLSFGVSPEDASSIGSIFGHARQATSADLILLPTQNVIGTSSGSPNSSFDKFGITYPLQDEHVLTPSEQQLVKTATNEFNTIIRTVAGKYNLALVDMNAIMNQLAGTGLKTEDGQVYTNNYFSTENLNTVLFSLDGIHPNARGYAIIANEIIKEISIHYKAHLPIVNVSGYPGATVRIK